MKERPILFSGPMVRAILEGRKTQTRRVVKGLGLDWLEDARFTPEYVASPENHLCPYGVPGDRLWVRETWACKAWTDAECSKVGCPDARAHPTDVYLGTQMRAIYRASYSWPEDCGPWRPSIHMPRWASRLTLEVTEVRAQRLQEMTPYDRAAEGVLSEMADRHISFGDLWDEINGKRAPWASNPWVWVVSFRRVQ